MKIITIIIIINLLAIFQIEGQVVSHKPFEKYYQRQNKTVLDSMAYGLEQNTNVFFLTSTIPFSFNRLERNDTNWHIGPILNVGYGAMFILGKSFRNSDDTRRIDPFLSFGIAGDFGVKQELEKLKTTLNGNLIIGFDKIAFTFGKDFLNNTTFIGVAARLDVLSFAPNHLMVLKEWSPKKL